jgi:hypothetical protein
VCPTPNFPGPSPAPATVPVLIHKLREQVRLLGLDRSDVGGQIADPHVDEIAAVAGSKAPEEVAPYRHFLGAMSIDFFPA